jgi:putative membrane protein
VTASRTEGPATVGRRFPRRVYAVGEEPDPRFSLANERTFLAWMRTSLALSAAGVALVAFDLPVPEGVRQVCAVLLIGLGLLAPVQAWFGWASTERALRRSRPLPSPRAAPALALGTALAGLLLVAGVLAG